MVLTSLRRYSEALPILEEATSFTTDQSDPQLISVYMGTCYQDTSQRAPAKEALLRAIRLRLSGEFEASARYWLALYISWLALLLRRNFN